MVLLGFFKSIPASCFPKWLPIPQEPTPGGYLRAGHTVERSCLPFPGEPSGSRKGNPDNGRFASPGSRDPETKSWQQVLPAASHARWPAAPGPQPSTSPRPSRPPWIPKWIQAQGAVQRPCSLADSSDAQPSYPHARLLLKFLTSLEPPHSTGPQPAPNRAQPQVASGWHPVASPTEVSWMLGTTLPPKRR